MRRMLLLAVAVGFALLARAEERPLPAAGPPQIPDVFLVDQAGTRHRLKDLVEGKVVAINFIFTRCTTICSPMAAIFARVQTNLGARPDRDVALLSISLDPAYDTPERLSAFGARFGRKSGWTLLTGAPADVTRVIRALGGALGRKEDHAPMVLVGDASAETWTRVYGLSSAERITAELERRVAARRAKDVRPPAVAPVESEQPRVVR